MPGSLRGLWPVFTGLEGSLMGNFELDINKFIKKCGDNADKVVRKTMFDLTKSIVERSPVGNPEMWANPDAKPEGYAGGHFRANWQLGVDSMPAGIIEGIDPTGTATLSKAQEAIPVKAAGHVYYYANNLPYASSLEEGHSHQAPSGMVGLAEVEFQGIINKASAELK